MSDDEAIAGRHRLRKKAVAARSPLDALSKQTCQVRIGGKLRTLTAAERVAHGLFTSALAGKVQSIRVVFGWLEGREKSLPTTQRVQPTLFEGPNYAHVDEAITLLGLAIPNPALDYGTRRGLQLDHDVVNLALAAVGQCEVKPSQREEITEHTKGPEAIRWPDEPADE